MGRPSLDTDSPRRAHGAAVEQLGFDPTIVGRERKTIAAVVWSRLPPRYPSGYREWHPKIATLAG